jgi:hypothetical protein
MLTKRLENQPKRASKYGMRDVEASATRFKVWNEGRGSICHPEPAVIADI